MTTTADAPRSPGRPRSVRADEAIISAALDLIAEGSTIEALSIEAIAARAGVGKATIYRRWPGKEALLIDAFRTLKAPPPEPVGLSLRDDLMALLATVGQHTDDRAALIMPCLIPEMQRSPAQHRIYQELVEPRRQAIRDVLRRGMATGELRDDVNVEVTMGLLTGPLLMQRMLRWNSHLDDETLARTVIDTVFAGITAR
jgi:AcrR family transcriptional regulator